MAKGIKKPLIVEAATFLVALFTFIFALKKYLGKTKASTPKRRKR